MDEAKFYWTVVVAVVSAGWIVVTFLLQRMAQSVDGTKELMRQLLEYDKLNIENPAIQQYISRTAAQPEAHFRTDSLLADTLFFQAKAMAYSQLNLFDQILSVSSTTRWLLLKPPALIEFSAWEAYMVEKLRHPLYRSILNREAHIFGASLRRFWSRHRKAIESKPADPFVW